MQGEEWPRSRRRRSHRRYQKVDDAAVLAFAFSEQRELLAGRTIGWRLFAVPLAGIERFDTNEKYGKRKIESLRQQLESDG